MVSPDLGTPKSNLSCRQEVSLSNEVETKAYKHLNFLKMKMSVFENLAIVKGLTTSEFLNKLRLFMISLNTNQNQLETRN